MKTTVAFRGVQARDFNKMASTKKFMVRPLNKDGSVSKAKPTKTNWQMDAFESLEKAEAHKAHLENLNPGHKFTIIPL